MSLNEQTDTVSEKSGAKNSNLHGAKKEKNDEFYTQIADIEKELLHYKPHFYGKVVLCNCDDPEWSNFYKYFTLNFEHLGLSRVITTHYAKGKPSFKLEYFGKDVDVKRTELLGDGDFRTEECLAILKESDIVVTNPPFSLFREYVATLVDNNKKFIILGNVNAITYKETFKLIKDNSLWLGPSISSGDREFRVPDSYPLNAAGYRVDEQGNKYIRVKGVRWFTNLPHEKRNQDLHSWATYKGSESMFPKYDNYDAIEVSKVADIPGDYEGVMGVPITFLDKYNPSQFEILGLDDHRLVYPEWRGRGPDLNGKGVYRRVIIKRISK